ncbi:MAG: hypothetical protein LAO05_05425, partial [Acidobacteriia bacterium]|nr:hypothetical protein [Terriglobia bacterium]
MSQVRTLEGSSVKRARHPLALPLELLGGHHLVQLVRALSRADDRHVVDHPPLLDLPVGRLDEP